MFVMSMGFSSKPQKFAENGQLQEMPVTMVTQMLTLTTVTVHQLKMSQSLDK
jgi:hypothetical protein